MAYNEDIAVRLRAYLPRLGDFEEKKMFGGLAFLLNGKMVIGVIKDQAVVRINPENRAEFLKKPDTAEMDFTGRPMKGFLYVSMDGIASDEDLGFWAEHAVDYVVNTILKGK